MIIALLSSGCVTTNSQPVSTEVTKLSIIKITPFGQNFKLWFTIHNKGSEPIYMRTFDYNLSLNNVPISKGNEALWRTIPAFSTYDFSIDLSANVWEQFKPIIATVKDTQKMDYYFSGELITGNIISQNRISIRHADTLTADDLPLKKIQRLQQFIPGLVL